ncbi:unnamed protein product [Prorocentrum cordatum]|uniref:Uncharacterized protein n=1 Tax=Prorocentrum cordatum TaxID=2364126 RepID=A0ABN9UNJ6_9DINO|nr:unnamed protein product [Polarella glacialis]
MREAKLRLDAFSFSAGISACEKSHQWQRALALLGEMRAARLEPDVISPAVPGPERPRSVGRRQPRGGREVGGGASPAEGPSRSAARGPTRRPTGAPGRPAGGPRGASARSLTKLVRL